MSAVITKNPVVIDGIELTDLTDAQVEKMIADTESEITLLQNEFDECMDYTRREQIIEQLSWLYYDLEILNK